MKRSIKEALSKWRYLRNHPAFRQAPGVTLARLVRWRVHCALGIPTTVNLDPWEVRLFLPPQWRGGGTTGIFALRHLYERELTYLEHLISPGMVVVDAGANCGIYTVAAARLVGPSGRVLSFEPGAQAFSLLKKYIEINEFHNVRAYRAALCDKNGRARLYHDELGQTSFSLGYSKNTRAEFEEVTTRTLDSVLEEERAGQVGLIKLDVEGAEELALRGVEKLLVRFRPKFILEMNAFAAERLELRRTGSWELLKSYHYDFFSLSDAGTPRWLNEPPAGDAITNVIAIHREQRNESIAHWACL
jgi:FkbM family methyltransferase